MSSHKIITNQNDITPELVQRLIRAQFPQWAHLPIKPVAVSGWDNRTFHLGEGMIVRLPSAEHYADQVAKEQYWLPKLARHLPLPIPVPLAMGAPAEGYPWHWSVYAWLEGDFAAVERINDLNGFAVDLANFLSALQRIDPAGGPPPGAHNFYRGGSLMVYDAETRQAITALEGRINTAAATKVWEAALNAEWRGTPVWVHGDVAAGNLLVRGGKLSAVIDFGCCCVGDSACDLVIAWTFFSGESREIFRAALALDDDPAGQADTWVRARGWALWKALIIYAQHASSTLLETTAARRVIDALLTEG